ncbi:MAG: alpha/beta hydrolase [Bacteroidota bacterium]
MKKVLFGFVLFFALFGVIYYFGPKPDAPTLEVPMFKLTGDLPILEKQISDSEREIKGIKSGCEAKIIWADSTKKIKTKIAFLYIHGFGATQMEGDPVHRNIAKKYQSNLYLARLAGHGIELGDENMAEVKTDDFVLSAEHALAVAKTLGNEVIIISTSFGSALTTYLASKHPDIKAIILYSPCIKVFDEKAEILDNPWGLQIGKLVNGSAIRDFKPTNEGHRKYWTTHQHLNGVVQLQNFLTHAMVKSTFESVKCPVFLGYWYKNENEQDKVVSVPAMLKMFEELGSANKQRFAFPKAGNHVIASPILSKDIETVQKETEKFLESVLKVENVGFVDTK